MLTSLVHLLFFFIDTVIIIAAILLTLAGILSIASKGKLKSPHQLRVKKLNESYTHFKETLEKATLSKAEIKKQEKLQKREKKQRKKNKTQAAPKPQVFVLDFSGDIKARAVSALREEITALLTLAKPADEVVLRLESGGGVVHGYGLAAAQLLRLKEKGIKLTICVDKIAASGGYMMACIADQLLAAPFAIIGSIGVIAQLPNFNRLLKEKHIDFEQITAGEYKRTLTVFGENTEKGREKMQEEIIDIDGLFKDFVKTQRPQLEMSKVATGEHWFGTRAKALALVDKLLTSDDYLLQASQHKAIYAVHYEKKKKLSEKFALAAQATVNHLFFSWWKESRENRYQ